MPASDTAPLTLREATADDIPALAELGSASFVAKFGHLYRPEDLASFLETTHSPATVAREFADPERLYCLAERGGVLAGYCKLGLVCGFPEHALGTRTIEIKQFYTDPQATGAGIGAAMMDWVLAFAHARAADEIQLSVWSENIGAQRFYARYGFEKRADIAYWVGQQRDDEFLLSLLLT